MEDSKDLLRFFYNNLITTCGHKAGNCIVIKYNVFS